MEKLKSLLTKPVAAARWLAFLAVTAAAAMVAWKVIGIWRASFGMFPELEPGKLGIASPWHPFFTFLLACFLCVLGAVPMLRDRRNLSAARILFELVYLILALVLLAALSEHLYYAFSTGHSGPAL